MNTEQRRLTNSGVVAVAIFLRATRETGKDLDEMEVRIKACLVRFRNMAKTPKVVKVKSDKTESIDQRSA